MIACFHSISYTEHYTRSFGARLCLLAWYIRWICTKVIQTKAACTKFQ